jgi:uncharacterized glyoxalase superfamily protein PhnB
MPGKVKQVPAGFHTATPCLAVNGAARAIEFYKKALGATEIMRFAHGDKIGHAEIEIGDSKIMISDEFPEMGVRGPTATGPARWRIRSATSGISPRTRKTCPRTSSGSVPTPT